MENQVRYKRNKLLEDCDWMFCFYDRPVKDKEAWIAYRQALRDVPQQAGFPSTINWPVKP
jgi:hypothetical protein